MPEVILTTEFLKEALDYNPETGKFFWKERPLHHFVDERIQKSSNTRFAGKEAGLINVRRGGKAKYVTIGIMGRGRGRLYAHRLAFIWMGIEIPDKTQIDHINRDSTDNRWCNLQLASNQENNFNAKRREGPNSHLPRGCDPRPNGKFTAKLRYNGIWHGLGTYDTPEQCTEARKKKAAELGIKNFTE